MKINLELIENLKVLALSCDHPRVFMAAALTYKNKIVSYGVANMKTHPFQLRFAKHDEAKFWHCETKAIYTAEKIGFDKFEHSTLYIVRVKWENKDKIRMVSGNSFCCSGCLEAVKSYKIKKVIYTLDDNQIGIYINTKGDK